MTVLQSDIHSVVISINQETRGVSGIIGRKENGRYGFGYYFNEFDSIDPLEPDYILALAAVTRAESPATIKYSYAGFDFAPSVFAFVTQEEDEELKSPPQWMLDLNPFASSGGAGGAGGSSGTIDNAPVHTLFYASFPTAAAALAGMPTGAIYENGFIRLIDHPEWTTTLADPTEGNERYVVQVDAVLNSFQLRQVTIFNPVQDSNTVLSTQYSVDADDWHDDKVEGDNYLRIWRGTTFSPPIRFTPPVEGIIVAGGHVYYNRTPQNANGYACDFLPSEFSNIGLVLRTSSTYSPYTLGAKQFIAMSKSQIIGEPVNNALTANTLRIYEIGGIFHLKTGTGSLPAGATRRAYGSFHQATPESRITELVFFESTGFSFEIQVVGV